MMSNNPFINNSFNNTFQTSTNPFTSKDNNNNNNNKQTQINQFFNTNTSNTNINFGQGLKTSQNKNQNLTSSNIFLNNQITSTTSQINNGNNQKQDNNLTNSFLNINPNQNKNIFQDLSNINKQENKNISIINTSSNINSNIINTNINQNQNIKNNEPTNEFFNINSKKNANLNIINTNKEEKEPTNIFLKQSNDILNKLNNDNNVNINANKNNEVKNHLDVESNNDINMNKEKSLLNGLSRSQNNNNSEGNNLNINKENNRADEFINNLFAEEKSVLADNRFSGYQISQINSQLLEEIINDFKNSLFSQKEEFKESVKNTRISEENFIQTCNNAQKEVDFAVENQLRYNRLLSEFNSIHQDYNVLEKKMKLRNNNVSEALDYLNKNSTNIDNNNNYIKRIDFEENNLFYKNLTETSQIMRKIDDDLSLIINSIEKSEQHVYESEKMLYENNEKDNELYSFSNNSKGVWIERNNNLEGKIYVEQKEMNELYNDCYGGLTGLLAEQEDIDKRCEMLKNKLIEKIKKFNNNNNFGNNKDNINNINNNGNINNYNNILNSNNN